MIRKLAYPVVLSVAGLALLVAAAFVVSVALGLAAAGVACLLLEWRVTE